MGRVIEILVPFDFSTADTTRLAAWSFVRRDYLLNHHGYRLVVGTNFEEDWSKGRALARARRRASGDVFVIADADCMVHPDALRDAVLAVINGAAWAVPYEYVLRYDQASTERLYDNQLTRRVPRLERGRYRGVKGGGIVVVRADVWDECPIDPQFVGWGGEDICWGHALRVLYGDAWQHPGDLVHLWHKPQEGSASREPFRNASKALRDRYMAATTPDEIREVLGSQRAAAYDR